jgi:hypothetical protein
MASYQADPVERVAITARLPWRKTAAHFGGQTSPFYRFESVLSNILHAPDNPELSL